MAQHEHSHPEQVDAPEAEHPIVMEGLEFLKNAMSPENGYAEIRKVRKEMYKQLDNLNLSVEDRVHILRAEAVLWSAMTNPALIGDEERCNQERRDVKAGTLLRRDGNIAPWHSYDVATKILNMKGDAQSVIYSLLHDAVEDSVSVNGNNKIDVGLIEVLSDAHTAKTIELLSEVSRSVKRSHTETLRRLLALIRHDPRGLAVKVADRINYWETASSMPKDKLARKANETLKFYVLFAKALGFHDVAQTLASRALTELGVEMPKENIIHKESYAKWNVLFGALLQGIVPDTEVPFGQEMKTAAALHSYLKRFIRPDESVARQGNAYDVIKTSTMARSELTIESLQEEVNEGVAPLYIPIVVEAPRYDKTNIGPDMWKANVGELARWFSERGYIPESAHDAIVHSLGTSTRSVRVRYRHDGITVVMIFIRPEDHIRWYATCFDQTSSDPNVRTEAIDKITSIQRVYALLDAKGAGQSLEDMLYLLKVGAKTITINGEEVGLPVDATALDAVYALAQSDADRKKIAKGVAVRSATDGRIVGLNEKLEGSIIVTWGSDTNGVHQERMSPDWFDICSMPTTKRSIQQWYKKRLVVAISWDIGSHRDKLQQTHTTQYIQDCLDTRMQLRKEGERILTEAFFSVSQNRGLRFPKKLVSFEDFIGMFGEVKRSFGDTSYDGEGVDARMCTDFLYHMALRMPGYTLDTTQTSLPYKVAQAMVQKQAGYRTFGIDVPNVPGALFEQTFILKRRGINIQDISMSGKKTTATIEVTVNEGDIGKMERLSGWTKK